MSPLAQRGSTQGTGEGTKLIPDFTVDENSSRGLLIGTLVEPELGRTPLAPGRSPAERAWAVGFNEHGGRVSQIP